MGVDITKLPEWIIAVARAHKDIERGTVEVKIAKNKGEVASITARRHKVTNFRNGDNREPLMMITDLIDSLSKEETVNLSFHLLSKNGKVVKLTVDSDSTAQFDLTKE